MASHDGSVASVQSWNSLSMHDKVSSFRVLCQGSTPDHQTVPRAELSAIAWVARWIQQAAGCTVDVYTDSQYAVDLWKAQQRRQQFDTAACNQDLAQWLWRVPGLNLIKVKAHNEAQAARCHDPFLSWTTAGNTAADVAARAARNLELSLVLQLSDTLAEHHYFQKDVMTDFCKYLVDLNLAEARCKAALEDSPFPALEPDDEGRAGFEAILDSWDYQGGSQAPEFSPTGNPGAFLWGADYGASLQAWALQLRWPCLPLVSDEQLGVTFLELLVHYVAWRQELPPVQVFDGKSKKYLPRHAPEPCLQPTSLCGCVGSFHLALRDFKRQFGVELIPGPVVKDQTHLRRLGLWQPQLGVMYRPIFSEAPGWIQLLRAVCEDTRMSHLDCWVMRSGSRPFA